MRQMLRLIGAGVIATGGLVACSDNGGPTTPAVQVQSVSVSPTAASVRVGGSIQAIASVTGTAGVSQSVTWMSADSTKARVNASGIITGVRTGEVMIVATAVADTTKKGFVQVSVTPAVTIRSIAIAPPSFVVKVGETVNTTVVVDAEPRDSTRVLYRSSDASKATVSATGVVTGIAPGTAVITAMAAADTNRKATSTVSIAPAQSPVLSFAITPATATINPGESFSAVSTLELMQGATQGTLWESQDPAIATVSAASGNTIRITAIKAGNVVITARPAADTSIARTIAVTVRSPVAAAATIQSVNSAATNLPVNPANVQGLINVIINVDAGDQQVDKIALYVDSTMVAEQNFTSQQSAAMKLMQRQVIAALANGQSAAASVAPITLTINTADYTVSGNAAAPKFANGARNIHVRLFVRGGAASGSLAATRGLTFNNASGFVGVITTNGQTASDAAGLKWVSGTVRVRALPLLYSGQQVATATISFPGHPSKTGLDVTFDSLAYQTTALPIGDRPAITAVSTTGDAIDLSSTPSSSGFVNYNDLSIRLDNLQPSAGTFTLNVPPGTALTPNGAWLNAAYTFSSGFTSGGDAGSGVGANGVKIFAGPAAAADSALVEITGAIGSALAASADSVTYRVQAREYDRVGNVRVTDLLAAPSTPRLFGIDNTAPNVAWVEPTTDANAISAGAIMPAAGARVFKLQSQDVGAAGNAASPVMARFTRQYPGLTAAAQCLSTFDTAAGTCGEAAYSLNTAVDNGTGLFGYFTFGGAVMDRAGNRAAFSSRTVLVDGQPPVAESATPTIVNDTIRVRAMDDVDLIRGEAVVTYNATGRIQLGARTFDTAFDGSPNGFGATIPTDANLTLRQIGFERTMYRQIIAVDGSNVPVMPMADPRAQTAEMRLFDAASNFVDAVNPIPVSSPVQTTFTSGSLQINEFRIVSASPASVTAASGSLTVNLSATRTGTADIQALIQRIDLYFLDGSTWKYLGSTDSGLRTEISGNSVWSYSTNITNLSAKGVPTGALILRAIAVDANNNGLLSNANASVTIN